MLSNKLSPHYSQGSFDRLFPDSNLALISILLPKVIQSLA